MNTQKGALLLSEQHAPMRRGALNCGHHVVIPTYNDKESAMFGRMLAAAANPTNLRCSGCGTRVSAWTSTCPGGRAHLRNDTLGNFFATLMMVMILYPIFNMPAFVPGAILTFLSMNILGSLGAWAILIMLAEFVFFTVIFWKILRTIYMKVHTFEGTIHTVTKGIFFAYVALCYAIPGIALINTDNPEANIGLRIFFGIAIFVCGLGYYSKRIKEE